MLIPQSLQWSNYADVWDRLPLMSWLLNSVVVGLAAALAVTVSSSLVAFGFSHFQFRDDASSSDSCSPR